MYVRPRPRFRPRNAGGVPFSPALLFTSGVAGAWYDPSDINNYTAQSGSELIVNGNFSNGTTGWSATNATLSAASNQLTITSTSSFGIGASTGFTTVVGRWYKASATLISCSAATARIRKTDSAVDFNSNAVHLVNGAGWYNGQVFTVYFQATATTTYIMGVTDLNPSNITIANVSVVETIGVANATLFQDSSGTTPVTAVEQPVGLMLDKSQGLVLGSELVTNGDFSSGTTGWTLTASASVSGGALVVSSAAFENFAVSTATMSATPRWYAISFDVTVTSGQLGVFVSQVAAGNKFTGANITTSGRKTGYVFSTSPGGGSNVVLFRSEGAFVGTIDNISVKELPGNHASQATAASRPVLRARYNQLTYSEQFDNAAWLKSTTPAITLTNQGSGVWRLQASAGAWLLYQNITSLPAGNSTFSIEVKSNGAGLDTFRFMRAGVYVAGDLTATSDWVRYTTTGVNTGSGAIGIVNSSSSTAIDVLIRFPSLVAGSSAGTYQRIAAATDYATAGFLPYLATDGTDDTLSSNSIDLTVTSKLSAVVGATKNNDSSVYAIVDFGATGSNTAGGFSMWAGNPVSGGAAMWASSFQSSAGGVINILSPTNFAAPATGVITTILDTVNAGSYLRVNGALQTTSAIDPTDGTFGNLPLRLSRTGANGLPGRIYQVVVCGKTLSASELASTEAYVATKTGVTL